MENAAGVFQLLPDESNLIRKMLVKQWCMKQAVMETLTENLSVEYSELHQRTELDSYLSFKETLTELSCIADALRKFGIHKKLDSAQTSLFMRIYADVIHTVLGWNERNLTLPHCLNITTIAHDKYVGWKDLHVKLWAYQRGATPDSKITPEHLFDDY